MNKRSVVSLLLAASLLAASVPSALAAGTNGTFAVSDAAGKAGETVTVTVSVENNPGIIAAAMRINYDSDKLELVNVQDEKLMRGTTTFSQNYTADPYYVSWNDALASENNKANGTLVTMTFRVLEDCPDGVSEIDLTFRPGDVFNKEMENQPFTAVSGTVTIGTGISEPTPDAGDDSTGGNTQTGGSVSGNIQSGSLISGEKDPIGNDPIVNVPQQTAPSADYAKFRDLQTGAWYSGDVAFMLEKGYMSGVSLDRFEPNGVMSRSQMVSILYRVAGSPKVTGGTQFADVPQGTWYTDAVTWASMSGIVAGTGADHFSPQAAITREQFATILYRSCGAPKLQADHLSGFADAGSVSGYAQEAMNWAVGQGILSGTGGNKLSPGATATRAQAAAMLNRYIKATTAIPVPDVGVRQ